MLNRGLSRIEKLDTYPFTGDLSTVESGTPIFADYSTGKLVATSAAVAGAKLLGFAFNRVMVNGTEKKATYALAENAKYIGDNLWEINAELYADIFKTGATVSVEINGTDATLVDTKEDVAAAGDVYLDAENKAILFYGAASLALASFDVSVEYQITAEMAQIDNQFNGQYLPQTINSITVISKAQCIAVDNYYTEGAPSAWKGGIKIVSGKGYLTTGSGETVGTEITYLGNEGKFGLFRVAL